MSARHDPAKIARNNRWLNIATVVLMLAMGLAYAFAKDEPASLIRPTKFVRPT